MTTAFCVKEKVFVFSVTLLPILERTLPYGLIIPILQMEKLRIIEQLVRSKCPLMNDKAKI